MTSLAVKRIMFLLVLLTPCVAMAQSPAPAPASSPPAPAGPPPAAAAPTAPDQNLLSAEQLDALVAPIALYPDPLLSQVLIASTYPLEIVQAERWLAENGKLKGDALKAAADKQGWDDSIKSLIATPSVLTMLSKKLASTQKLGDAVLAQQPDVMDAIQRLRSRAVANNKLTSGKQQTVTVKQEQDKRVVVIEPTDPQTVYVPYYDPTVVYGTWPSPAYPPETYPAPSYIAAGIIGAGIAFGAGYALGRWATGGNYWGGAVAWGGGNIYANRSVNIANSGNVWQHRREHRHGVRYNNPGVRGRFGNNALRGGAGGRLDFRGRGGERVLGGGRGPQGPNRVQPRRDNAFGNMQGGRAAKLQAARGRASVGNRAAYARRAGGGQFARGGGRRGYGGGFGGGYGGRGFGGGGFGGRGFGGGGFGGGGFGGGGFGGRGFGGGGRGFGGGGRGFGGGGRGFGGGGFRGGGRSFGGGRGGGRRSDIRLKHDILMLGRLDNGLGFYRFVYNGGHRAYVGVMAQEVQRIAPQAVIRDSDGYLEVLYDRLGVKFDTYEHWLASGARIPVVSRRAM